MNTVATRPAEIGIAANEMKSAYRERDIEAYMSFLSPAFTFKRDDGVLLARDQHRNAIVHQFKKLKDYWIDTRVEESALHGDTYSEKLFSITYIEIRKLLGQKRYCARQTQQNVWRQRNGTWKLEAVDVLEVQMTATKASPDEMRRSTSS